MSVAYLRGRSERANGAETYAPPREYARGSQDLADYYAGWCWQNYVMWRSKHRELA